MCRNTLHHVPSIVIVAVAAALANAGGPEFAWRYYRPGNTGIQGDYNEAIWLDANGDPYIGGYDPFFEEGGFVHFIQAENRWINFSNVDYPVIGHPDNTGTTRVRDIVPEATGRLWLGTWRGALSFDPAVGATSLTHYGPGNSALNEDFVWDIDRAPDGTIWFANNGSARFNPATSQWTRWDNMGNVFLAVQPKATGGYLVWSSQRPPQRDYTFIFDSDTQQWTVLSVAYPFSDPGAVVGMPGKDCVDEAGNFWALRLTSPGDFDSLDYRRVDGTWVTPPEPYNGVTFSISAFKAYGNARALLADGNGFVFQFNGSSWTNLGQGGPGAYSLDIDAAGNIWVCGVGGAAKRNVQTGQWQRYRITNTGNYDSFQWDLTIDTANGHMYSGANAAPGVGGMVRFDGERWTGWNTHTYGLGHDWPFPNDNCHALAYRPSNGHVAVSPLNWLYGIHEWTGSGFIPLMPTGGAQRMVEDSLGRLWALGEYFNLQYFDGVNWNPVGIVAWGSELQRDPEAPGTIWATTGHEIKRTDGSETFSRMIDDFPELDGSHDTFRGLAAAPNGIAWVGATMLDASGGALIRLNGQSGTYQMLRYDQNWGGVPLPGNFVAPLAVTPDGRVWMSYALDFQTPDGGGLCSYDPQTGEVENFPGPLGGGPQWGGLPHSQVADCEVRVIPGGYELWLACVSRGIAVLTVTGTVVVGDINGDGSVDIDDLLAVIAAWGDCPKPPIACPADLNNSGDVTIDDLLLVIGNWG